MTYAHRLSAHHFFRDHPRQIWSAAGQKGMGAKAALQEGRQANVGKVDDLVKSGRFGGEIGPLGLLGLLAGENAISGWGIEATTDLLTLNRGLAISTLTNRCDRITDSHLGWQ